MVINRADRIVVTSSQFKEDFLKLYPYLAKDNIHFVPNGFDPEDFSNVGIEIFNKITILHSGHFYIARSSANFLRGLYSLLNKNAVLRSQIQVIFIGVLDAQGQSLIIELGLEDVVIQKGVVSHSESIRYICSADVLLLVPGPGRGTMTGKIFEYLAAKKPILVLADEGPARDLVTSTRIGVAAPASDINAIEKELDALLKIVMSKEKYPYPDVDNILMKYDRRNIAGEITGILNNAISKNINTKN